MGNRGAYLLKDGNSYYFRVKIPKQLKDIFKSGQIKKSLQTDDLQKAEKMELSGRNPISTMPGEKTVLDTRCYKCLHCHWFGE